MKDPSSTEHLLLTEDLSLTGEFQLDWDSTIVPAMLLPPSSSLVLEQPTTLALHLKNTSDPRMYQQKVVTGAIIAVLVLLIILVLWSKFR